MTSRKRALPPTQKDIARIVGVSPMVVSEVLKGRNDRIRAAETTRIKILETAARLHYRLNGSARAMRENRFRNIGYLAVREPDDYSVEATESGICEEASARNYQVTLIKHRQGWNPTEDDIPSIYREAHLDALIVDAYSYPLPPLAQRYLKASGFPIVYYNEKKARNAVYVDDVAGARELTRHLAGQGYRKIAYLALDMKRGGAHYSIPDRLQGYRLAMEEAGLRETVAALAKYDDCDFRVGIAKWLGQARPEAVVCYSDSVALILQKALRDLAWRVPHDIAIAGFNGDSLAEHSPVPLTTVRVPFFEMARVAVEMAVGLAEGDASTPLPSRRLASELLVSESTMRPAVLKRQNTKESV